jgi:hypothetical protein
MKAQNDVNTLKSQLDIANKDLVQLESDVGNVLQNSSSYVQDNTVNAKSAVNNVRDILESVDKIFSFTTRNDVYTNSYNKKFI